MKPTPERRAFDPSLGTRLFLATALLVIAAVGAAVLITALVGQRIAAETVERALERSGSVQSVFQNRSLEQLRLTARTLGDDPAFASYFVESLESGDVLSALDQLSERQLDLGFEIAMMLDAEGILFARTDDPNAGGLDLSEDPLIITALDELEARGAWSLGNQLYEAAAVPVGAGGYLYGYLVAGRTIDDAAALELRRISGTEVSILAQNRDGAREIVATTLDAQLAEDLGELLGPNAEALSAETSEIDLGGQRWLAGRRPLVGADGEEIGGVISLASLDEQLAPFRRIQRTLWIVGAVAVLLALAVSHLISRWTLGPVRRLAAAAKAAAEGDYDQQIDVDRGDEVGNLAAAFGKLLSELREKRDMETYLSELSRNVFEEEATLETAAEQILLQSRSSATGLPPAELGTESDAFPTLNISNPGPPGQPPPARPAAPIVSPSHLDTLTSIGPGIRLGGRFTILSQLGAGGMGVVYKARDESLGELVALKMLKPEVWDDSERLANLKSELKLARKIAHPNVLRTYDFGELDDVPFISMEYVRGINLRQLLKRSGRLPFTAGLRLARQLCRGLDAAHGQAVIHRDIKPENLLLEPTGNLKLMDFGIAQRIERNAEPQKVAEIVGTPFYLAPEQLQGREADERTDLYACGVVLYEIFTGTLPFPTDGKLMQILTIKVQKDPIRASEAWSEIPAELEAILMRCLERDPSARYADIATLLDELEVMRG